MDIRKEMAKSIYLSGGVTMLPGFPERLQAEVTKLTPATVSAKVTRNTGLIFLISIFYLKLDKIFWA